MYKSFLQNDSTPPKKSKKDKKYHIFYYLCMWQKPTKNKEISMNDNEIDNPPIKALIVYRDNGETNNLFVPILCDAIRTTGINVQCSMNEFWDSDTPYDIIHFQWPEEVMGWNCDDSDRIRLLEERIAFFQSRGARFVYTRHNIRPHYANEAISRAYDIIEEKSDVVVHMGRYSLDEFAAKHPFSRNVIIPHHIYQYTYKEDISVEKARQYLNLPQKAFIVTSFGEFRNREERRMMTGAFRKWNEKNKFLLAPRFYPFSRFNRYGSNFFKRWASRTGYYLFIPLLNRLSSMHAGASDEPIDNCDLPYYMAASDVIFIQRKDILNSASIPLAFLFHKVVIGPNIGNIGEILHDTGNPVFHPDNKFDIVRALEAARQLSAQRKGKANYAYAIENMNSGKIGKEYAKLYRNLATLSL